MTKDKDDSNHPNRTGIIDSILFISLKASTTSLASADSVARKKSSWYSAFNPNYKRRAEDFKKTFPTLPSDERLIVGMYFAALGDPYIM